MPERYRHDCTACVYLGCFVHDGQTYDLFFCRQGGTFPTVIARYGDEGVSYTSGIYPGMPVSLMEAYNRALSRGLLA